MSSENTMPSTTREIVSSMNDKPGTDRRGFLFNNEFMSDVTFLVGPDKQRFYGHKLILINASDHFFDLLQNSRTNEVTLEDVEPSVFLEILRFLYCEKIELTAENVREIYTHSKKWSLEKVLPVVNDFLRQNVDSDNVLEKLMDNRFYGLKSIDEKCLQIICDNPLRYFKQKNFVQLDRVSLKLIVSAKRINCSSDQLMEVVDGWQKTHSEVDVEDLKTAIRSSNPQSTWPMLRFVGEYSRTGPSSYFLFHINSYIRGIKLIGMGIFFKSNEEVVTVTVSIDRVYHSCCNILPQRNCTFKNPCVDTVNIADIFFEPIYLESQRNYKISAAFKTTVKPLSMATFQTYHNYIQIVKDKSSESLSTPIAHFYYQTIY
ncbi:BTB/POZ domain-containing protein 6-A-like [Topomyia yanbarensis]|uniref:BTB/POZ domain-containing protein 6-A-like n=1 Tax=Topomyia yanbarensis TaxID=2498891 RepID=UPI00273C293E|nr:BTB/POZ domain-containing protein 6-A-like [Topomyia yanbarensis]